jgi:hypothetical protein
LGSNDAGAPKLDDESLETSYQGLNRFLVNTRADGFSFVLERDGLATWKLAEVRLPESWRLPALPTGTPTASP